MPLLLLLLPLVLLAAVLAGLVLVPLALRQRYRMGHARRRAWGWLLRVNAWGLLASLLLFIAGAWFATHWSTGALHDALAGTAAGLALGLAGIALTRFDRDRDAVYYTPNRWMALALTLVVASRIVAGFWWSWRRVGGGAMAASAPAPATLGTWLDAGGVWTIAGLLLAYATAFACGVHLRYRALSGRRD